MKKDKEYLQSVIQRHIDNLPNTYEGLYIEGLRDAFDLVLQDIDELDESEMLSQEWIDKNKTSTDRKLDGTPIYKVREELLQNPLVPKHELPVEEEFIMTKLETLTVPRDLGEWLQSRGIGESLTYFSTIDALYHHWEGVISSPTGSFITDNKKELIEVILGTRGYRVEAPLYYALAKGHELTDGDKVYWVHDKNNDDMFIGILHSPSVYFLSEMSKSEWNELGINDSNADFVKVREVVG